MEHVIRSLFSDAGSRPAPPLHRRHRRRRPRSRSSHSVRRQPAEEEEEEEEEQDELEELRRENARLRRDRDRALEDLEAEERLSDRLRRERNGAERDLDRLRRDRDALEARESARLRDERDRAPRRQHGRDPREGWSAQACSTLRGRRIPIGCAGGGGDAGSAEDDPGRSRHWHCTGCVGVDGGESEWDAWYDGARRYAHTSRDCEDGGSKKGLGGGDGLERGRTAASGRWDHRDESAKADKRYDGMDPGSDRGPDETDYGEEEGDTAAEDQADDWMDGGWFSELLAGDS